MLPGFLLCYGSRSCFARESLQSFCDLGKDGMGGRRGSKQKRGDLLFWGGECVKGIAGLSPNLCFPDVLGCISPFAWLLSGGDGVCSRMHLAGGTWEGEELRE